MITRNEWIENLDKEDMTFDKDKKRKILFYTATQSTWGGRWWCHFVSVSQSGLTIGGLLNPCPQEMEKVFPLERCFWNEEEAKAECKKRNIKGGWEKEEEK